MNRSIIASDVPGWRETVDDEITGFLCRPYDAQDLAEEMKRMLLLPGSRENDDGTVRPRKE